MFQGLECGHLLGAIIQPTMGGTKNYDNIHHHYTLFMMLDTSYALYPIIPFLSLPLCNIVMIKDDI